MQYLHFIMDVFFSSCLSYNKIAKHLCFYKCGINSVPRPLCAQYANGPVYVHTLSSVCTSTCKVGLVLKMAHFPGFTE